MIYSRFGDIHGRRSRVAFAIVLSSLSLAASAAPQIDLRGYGKVTADLTPARTVFTCDSVPHADVLLDKLQADLFWDKTLRVRKSDLKLNSVHVTVYSLPGYGAALIARSGVRVVILGGADERAVSSRAAKELLLQAKDVTSRTAAPHPMYLDYYDIRAFKAYVPPVRAPEEFGLETRRPFLRSFGGSTAFFGPNFQFKSPAQGVIDFAAEDYPSDYGRASTSAPTSSQARAT